MINLFLTPHNFKYKRTSCDVRLYLGYDSFDFRTTILKEIKHFNDEIKWGGMFDLTEAIRRLNVGMSLYVLFHDNNPVGHVWFEDRKDYKFLFNLFVRNKVDNKCWSGTNFISHVIECFERYKEIRCEVDEWNVKSLRLFKTLGFEEYIE